MGPSLFSDGKPAVGCAPARQLLQWGRRCSATERSSATADAAAAPGLLQWGRRCSATERHADGTASADAVTSFNGAVAVQRRKDRCGGQSVGVAAASMGPSLFSDGKATAELERRRDARFNGAVAFSDGKACADERGAASAALQWGRRFRRRKATASAGSVIAAPLSLQWGRRFRRRKGEDRLERRRSTVRFNGAVAFADGKVSR